ncbi:DNA-binding protein [Enterococcus italicus]|uniref:DNA-binding protein n=1 Tax=Enterococcus italicus TaxID=246144 RepID=UPI0028A91E73|nr:DNA-binding protein [Enterococcus italicus]
MKISQMKNVVPLERKNGMLEVEWKKAKEIADYLGISRPTLSKLTHRDVDPIPFSKLSGILQYDFQKVKEWEKRNRIFNNKEA